MRIIGYTHMFSIEPENNFKTKARLDETIRKPLYY